MKQRLYLPSLLCLLFLSNCNSQTGPIDSLEFQLGYPGQSAIALEQLKNYPAPRYKNSNDLIRLFNWMNPAYMGGQGQAGITNQQYIKTAVDLEEELITHWNYFIFIPNSTFMFNEEMYSNPKSLFQPLTELANKHPEVPLATTIFWLQLQPQKLGGIKKKSNIALSDLPDKFYIKDASGKVIKRRINFAAPDSLFAADGQLQKKCLQNLMQHLTRPINFINENGEEGAGAYGESTLSGDADMIADKEKLHINDWKIYAATKKQHQREVYASQFMSLPELKNTWFSVYAVEGGPIDRFDWNASKKTGSAIKGNYYSTPDFYPRTPDNWRTWKGAWHGWKWINDGRNVELKSGDRFFSPFVSPGWSVNPEADVRPAQWLGLLKSLSVVGAEFYYVAYFNLKKPYSKPEDYVWQVAMPAYAQAITSHFNDIFRNGNVMFDAKGEPLVTYPINNNKDKDLLVTVRKHNFKKQYIIAATVQPSSNTVKAPFKKNAEITIDGISIQFEARRQGSVYFLDMSSTPYVFYQLDKWHQYEHPSRWRKELIYEAEVSDTSSSKIDISSIYVTEGNKLNFSNSASFIRLNKNEWVDYEIDARDLEQLKGELFLKLYFRSNAFASGTVSMNDWKMEFKNTTKDKWMWISIPMKEVHLAAGQKTKLRISSENEVIELDKFCISSGINPPDLSNY